MSPGRYRHPRGDSCDQRCTPAAGSTDTYGYDDLGNIKSKSDFSLSYGYGSVSWNAGAQSWVRGTGNAGPHAVQQVTKVAAAGGGSASFNYDANGNLTSGDGRAIDFDEMDRPGHVISGAITSEFRYGPGGERYLQKVTGAGQAGFAPKTVYYLNKDFELTVWDTGSSSAGQVEERTFVGGSVVTLTTVTAAAVKDRKIRYLHVDRLGSVEETTEEVLSPAPLSAGSHGFDPWGKPRSGTWAPNGDRLHPNGEAGDESSRGFTGHEQLDVHSLTHMNGRVYDYRLGRFLSVDPIISNPASTQSINPYSYIGNNPLSGVDPTGYAPGVVGPDSNFVAWERAGNVTVLSTQLLPTEYADLSAKSAGAATAKATPPNANPTGVGSVEDINKGGSSSIPTLGDLADGWERYRQSYREWLASRLAPGTTLGEKAGLATLTLSVELGAGFADLGRLGKGASDGGIKGLAQDGLRALSLGLMGWGLSRSLLSPGMQAPQLDSAPLVGAGEGAKLFRVWGGEAGPWGRSWTTVDPRSLTNFRDAAGLPPQNAGRFLSEGVLQSTEGVMTRPALQLPGTTGGLPEVVVPNPASQIRLQSVQGLNPEF